MKRVVKWVPIVWEPDPEDPLGGYRADVPDEVRAGGVGGARILLDYEVPPPSPPLTALCRIRVRKDVAALVPDRVPDALSLAVCELCFGNVLDAQGRTEPTAFRAKLTALNLTAADVKPMVARALIEATRYESGLRLADAEKIREDYELGDAVYVREPPIKTPPGR